MNAPLPKLYTSADAAMFLGVKVCTVRNECRRGRLGFVTIGGRFVRHTEEHLVAYVRNREVAARPIPPSHASFEVKPAEPNYGRRRADRETRDATSSLAQRTFAPAPRRITNSKKDAA